MNALIYGSITGFIIGFMWPKVRRWRERRRAWKRVWTAVAEIEKRLHGNRNTEPDHA